MFKFLNRQRKTNKFIVLEGVDGSGKTTAAHCLADRLGYEYVKTPGDIFAAVRPLFEDKAHVTGRLYFYLGTVLYASEDIKKKLAAGKGVICDRYIYTTICYQRAMGAQVSKELEKEIISELRMPDMTLFLYADKEARHQRLGMRQEASLGYRGDQWLEQNDQFQEKLVKLFRRYPMKTVDTSKLNPEQVCETLLKLVNKK